MIIDDEGDYISGSGLGTDIPLPFNRYIVHTYHNGKRDNVNYGGDRLDCMSSEHFGHLVWR